MPALRDQVDAALAAARRDGLGRAAAPGSARTSTTSGRAPTSRSTATPRCSRRCGSRSSRSLQAGARAEQRAIPAKGLTGQRLRRPHLLGHGDLHAAGADLHRAGGRARRAALAPLDARPRARARARAAAGGRGVPVAHDPRRGVLRLLAGGHRGVPHQRRHRRRGPPLRRARRGDEEFERGPGPRAAGRDRAAVALARPPRPGGRLPHRRRHRARRVHRARRQQRLHEPDGGPEPPPRRDLVRAPPAARGRARRRRGGDRRLARRRRRDGRPVRRRRSASRRSRRASRATAAGTSRRRPTDEYPLLLHYPYYLLYSSQVVKQADLVFALYLCGDHFNAEQKRRDFDYYERDHGPRLVAVGARSRRSSPPRSGTSTSPTSTAARRRSSTCATSRATRATACTSRRWRAPGSRPSPGFGGLRDHGDTLCLRAAPPAAPDAARVPAPVPRPAAARRGAPRRGHLRAARRRAARAPALRRGARRSRRARRRSSSSASRGAAHGPSRPPGGDRRTGTTISESRGRRLPAIGAVEDVVGADARAVEAQAGRRGDVGARELGDGRVARDRSRAPARSRRRGPGARSPPCRRPGRGRGRRWSRRRRCRSPAAGEVARVARAGSR